MRGAVNQVKEVKAKYRLFGLKWTHPPCDGSINQTGVRASSPPQRESWGGVVLGQQLTSAADFGD